MVEQVLDPFLNPREHGLGTLEDLVARVAKRAEYRARFVAAYGDPAPSAARIADALVAFIQSLDPGSSRFDRYLLQSERSALTEPELRGYELFKGAGQCASCHTVGEKRARFTDNKFHSVSIGAVRLTSSLATNAQRAMSASPAELALLIAHEPAVAALGRFTVTRKPSDIGKYRTPSLRQVALTAPYMHDGSISTLEEAIDHEVYYRSTAQGRPLILTPKERSDLAAFLRALTSESLERQKRTQQ